MQLCLTPKENTLCTYCNKSYTYTNKLYIYIYIYIVFFNNLISMGKQIIHARAQIHISRDTVRHAVLIDYYTCQ